ncbi:MAG: hypothetical protein ACKVU0_10765 [Saprospiraceae bacterium]
MFKGYFRLPTAYCYCLLATTAALCLLACGSPSAPLDAETRMRIDSISNAQIARAQTEHDSLCKAAQITQLPHFVDSIKKIRLREIEEQLKTVPR